MNKFVIARLALLFLGGCNEKHTTHATPEDAAKAGLIQFQAILKAHPRPANLVASKREAGELQLQLGAPLDVQDVYLSDLRNFDGSNVTTHDTGTKFFPIVAGGEIVSSLYVGQKNNAQWAASSFGDPARARAIAAIKGDFIIKVPALKVTFVASRTDGAVRVAPIADDPRFSFIAERSLLLSDALVAMKPFALKVPSDVPN